MTKDVCSRPAERCRLTSRVALALCLLAVGVGPVAAAAGEPEQGAADADGAHAAVRDADRQAARPAAASDDGGTVSWGSGGDRAARGPSSRAPRAAGGERIELDVDVSAQTRAFVYRGDGPGDRVLPSLALRLDYYREWHQGDDAITVVPFVRWDAADDARSGVDLREAYWMHAGDGWRLRAGIRRVFWGVTESKHLVDVINQVDLAEDIDEEARLGQPMVQLSTARDWGSLDLYMLLGFRERTYPGLDGRLAGPLPIAGDAELTSSADRYGVDGAIRWSRLFGELELALAHFSGTTRAPRLQLRPPTAGRERPRLVPLYEHIDQSSLEAQWVHGDTAWKLELISRAGQGPRFTSFVAGFEHTLVGVAGTRADVGLLAEYLYDERDENAPLLAHEHDIFLGTRLALNDPAGSEALLGGIWDPETDELLMGLEASRRFGSRWKLSLEARVFAGVNEPDARDPNALFDPEARWGVLARDDYVQLDLVRYF